MADVVRELRDQVSQIVGGLVPDEWSGDAADAFARSLNDQIVRNLLALSEAASKLGGPLQQLAADIRAANRQAEQALATAKAAGLDIDSYGSLSSDRPQSIERLIAGPIEHLIAHPVDAYALTEARETMLAARRIAESGWDAARHALVNVQVPNIGNDSLPHAVDWGFEHAVPSEQRPPDSGGGRTGRLPTAPRPDGYAEEQRVDGVRFVQEHCEQIKAAADHYRVPPEAIAGAVLWEAVEDPHRYRIQEHAALGPGPGKVHWIELPTLFSDAERAENHGLIPRVPWFLDHPPPVPYLVRYLRVQDPSWAIRYIGAVLRDNADIYEKAGFEISTNVGVLLTLYEGGDAERKAQDLVTRRRHDSSAAPEIGAAMGVWVVDNRPWIRAQLPCLD